MLKRRQLKKLVTQKQQGSFGLDVGKLFAGSGAAALIAFAAIPLISRIYPPADVGMAAYFISISSILAGIGCLRYELAVLLPDKDSKAFDLIYGIIAVLICVTIAFTIILIGVSGVKGRYSEVYPNWLVNFTFLSFVSIFSISELFKRWSVRKKSFGLTAYAHTAESGVLHSGQILIGLIGSASPGGLVIGAIMGKVTGASIHFINFLKTRPKDHTISPSESLKQIKRYKKFPAFNTPSSFINLISTNLPLLIFGSYFSPAAAGAYALAYRLLGTPLSLAGKSIGQVYTQRAANIATEAQLAQLTKTTFRKQLILSALPLTIVALIGSQSIITFLGPQWEVCGPIVEYLSLWAFGWIVTSPLSQIFSVSEHQGTGLALNILSLLAKAFGLGIGVLCEDLYLSVLFFSIASLITHCFMLSMIFKITHNPPLEWVKQCTQHALSIAPFVTILVLLDIACENLLLLIISSFVSVLFHLLIHKKILLED